LSDSLPTPDSVEDVAPGLTIEWYSNHRIAAFILTTVTQSTIDAFIEAVHQVEQNWAEEQPRLFLYDFAHKEVSLTPYLRQRIEDITTKVMAYEGRTAFVIAKDIISHSMRLFVVTNFQRSQQNTDIFFTREAGLKWLMETLPE
jgi:hypothetical protein